MGDVLIASIEGLAIHVSRLLFVLALLVAWVCVLLRSYFFLLFRRLFFVAMVTCHGYVTVARLL